MKKSVFGMSMFSISSAVVLAGVLSFAGGVAPAQAGSLKNCRLDSSGQGTHVCQCYVLQNRLARGSVLAALAGMNVCGAPGISSGSAFESGTPPTDECGGWRQSTKRIGKKSRKTPS